MKKLLKWGLMTSGGVVLLGWLLFGSSFASYGEAILRNARSAAEDAVPLDLHLDRVAVALEEADEQFGAQRERLADVEVGVEDLQGEISELSEKERMGIASVEQLREAYLATGNGSRKHALYRGRKVNAADVGRSLDAWVVKVEGLRRRRDMKNELLATRMAHLQKLRDALQEGAMRRSRLEASLETRRVELECARLCKEDLGSYQPGSALRDAELALGKVDHEIRVMKKLGDLERDDTELWLTDVRSGEALQERAARLFKDAPTQPDLEPSHAPLSQDPIAAR